MRIHMSLLAKCQLMISSKPERTIMTSIEINLVKLTGTPNCVGAEDGEIVFAAIQTALTEGNSCIVSFQGIEMLTSAFLNVAFGKLYGAFNEELIRERLKIHEINKDDTALLKRAIDNAKSYYNDPDRMERSAQEILGDH